MTKRGLRNSHGRRSVRLRPARTAESERRFSRLSPKGESAGTGSGEREQIVSSEATGSDVKPATVDPARGSESRPAGAARSAGSFEGTLAKSRALEEEERLLAHFFAEQPPRAAGDEDDEAYKIPMSVGSRRAMWASLWIFGVSLLGIGGYSIYQSVVLPAPIELGDSALPLNPPTPPQPTAAALEAERQNAQRGREALRASLQEPGQAPGAVAAEPGQQPTAADAPGAGAEPGQQPMAADGAPSQQPLTAPGAGTIGAQPSAAAAIAAQEPTAAEHSRAGLAPERSPIRPPALVEPGAALPALGGAVGQPSAASDRAETSLSAALDPSSAVAPTQPPSAAGPAALPALVPALAPIAAPIPQPIAGSVTPSADELIEVARDFARKGRYLKAQLAYEQALATQPSSAPALAGIAYTYLNTGDQQTAKQYATRAVAIDPQSSQGWIVLGAAQESLGDLAGAREAYRRCATEAVGSYVVECRKLAR
jgi:tetratricopeptide (TPR) repeat protein